MNESLKQQLTEVFRLMLDEVCSTPDLMTIQISTDKKVAIYENSDDELWRKRIVFKFIIVHGDDITVDDSDITDETYHLLE